MITQGTTFHNKFTGDVIEFAETAADTNGAYTKFLFRQQPDGFKPVEHIHTLQDETFEVVSGELTYTLNGKGGVLKAGEKIVLPKGIKHQHNNESNKETVYYQIISPALDVEIFLENLLGLAAEGKVKNGEPELLQLLLWSRNLQSKTYIAKLPASIQRTLSYILSPVAKLRGYKTAYARFSGYDM